jgi:hypothetical protein
MRMRSPQPFSLGPVAALALALALLCLGCPIGHQSPPARAQEAATELNVNTRFGRMELAAEKVAPAARDAFLERRRSWGANIRVADYEMTGFRMMKGESDAEMLVKVAWYRIDQGDLRITVLKQKWHDFKGDWKLVEEARADGDLGLIGEPLPAPPPRTAPARPAHFPTIHLGATATPPASAPETTPPGDAPAASAAGDAPPAASDN